MSANTDPGRAAEEMREEIVASLNAAFHGFSFPGGRWSTGYGAEMAADTLLSGPLAPILQEAAQLRARLHEAEKGVEAMQARRKGLEDALIAVRDRILNPICSGITDTFWMTERETVVDFIDVALIPPEQGKLDLTSQEGGNPDPGRAAYEARFAHARPRDVEPWDSLTPEVKAIWARVEAACRDLSASSSGQNPANSALSRHVQSAAWPSGCIKPGSCSRHRQCVYAQSSAQCRHLGKDLTDEIKAAAHARELAAAQPKERAQP